SRLRARCSGDRAVRVPRRARRRRSERRAGRRRAAGGLCAADRRGDLRRRRARPRGWHLVARRRRDYYTALGVSRDATEAEIKRAFRELARKHHPDVSPGNNGEAFREINEAYAVLSDRDTRARYDRWGH